MKEGSIVVCVDDTNWSFGIEGKFNKLPIKGKMYTVSKIHPNYSSVDGPPGVSVEGIFGEIASIRSYTGKYLIIEWHFKMKRFKEIYPPKSILNSDIESLFKTESFDILV
jgi:hypothetical protein